MEFLIAFGVIGYLMYLGFRHMVRKVREFRLWATEGDNLMVELLPRGAYVLLFFTFVGLLGL